MSTVQSSQTPVTFQDVAATRDAARKARLEPYITTIRGQIDAQINSGRYLVAWVDYKREDALFTDAIVRALETEFPGFVVKGRASGCSVSEPSP
jgi:hypothetical protein